MNPLLEAALEARLQYGWSLLPIYARNYRDKDPHHELLKNTGFKVYNAEKQRYDPTWKPLQSVPPTEEQLYAWFSDPHEKGLALITGQLSNRVIIDFDGEAGKALAWDYGVQPHVQTGGGFHYHLTWPGFRVKNIVGKTNAAGHPEIDVRGDGGNAIIPPTCTHKGPYRYLRDPCEPDSVDDLPVALRESLKLYPEITRPPAGVSGPLPRDQQRYPSQLILDWAVANVNSGEGRNSAGSKLAWVLFNNGYSRDEVLQVGESFTALVSHLKMPPYTMQEFKASANSAEKAERGEPWGRAATQRPNHKPPTPAHALEDTYAQLPDSDKRQAAFLLAFNWALQRRPVSETLTYLRLIGAPDSAAIARAAYEQFHAQLPPETTLERFLAARGIRFAKPSPPRVDHAPPPR